MKLEYTPNKGLKPTATCRCFVPPRATALLTSLRGRTSQQSASLRGGLIQPLGVFTNCEF